MAKRQPSRQTTNQTPHARQEPRAASAPPPPINPGEPAQAARPASGGPSGMRSAEIRHPEDHIDHEPHHIVPLSTYNKTFAWLMVLLVLTLVAAAFELGPLNLPVAMLIAVVKALFVFIVFMHLKWSSKLVQFFAGAAFLWLVVMFTLTLADYVARNQWNPPPAIQATPKA